jgi:hypothetical protein
VSIDVHLWGALRPFADDLRYHLTTLYYRGAEDKKCIVKYLSRKNEDKIRTL